LIQGTLDWLALLLQRGRTMGFWDVIDSLPFFVQVEISLQILILGGVAAWILRKNRPGPKAPAGYHPSVTCVITCYSEGPDVARTIRSLALQLYPGTIEIMPMVDGSVRNSETLAAVLAQQSFVDALPNRTLRPVSKPQRGGRVSSLNSGRALARGEIIMAMDGDTSFTNDTVALCTRHFADPDCVAVSGNLRVRNSDSSWVAAMQAIEYNLGIAFGRIGLAEWGIINNISGAFGIFRKSLLDHIGGWDTGTAEDLDITTRIKGYFGRHPNLRIAFEPNAIGFTDGPVTVGQLYRQRDRWDGDLTYIYLRKYRLSFNPRILGWKNFLWYTLFGLVFQITIPFLVVGYYFKIIATFPFALVLAISLWTYMGYLAIAVLLYAIYLGTVSRYPKEDLWLALLLPFQPLYAFTLRVCMTLYTLKSVLMRSHLDSGMAPWWVLKKGIH
jgi:cellulose synthase/poly-beta-1,6-N-acetylglucosamine synthase-like glycosyltransferase